MADINLALRQTLASEGGYSNNPNDSGGETVLGIARNIHPEWSGWSLVDTLDKSSIVPFDQRLMPYAASFYKTEYWDKMKLDSVADQNVCNELFDSAVNMGVGFTSKMLQRALNLLNRDTATWQDIAVDGAIGNGTISVLNRCLVKDSVVLFNLLNVLQGMRYVEICESRTSQEVFLRGWLSRVQIIKV